MTLAPAVPPPARNVNGDDKECHDDNQECHDDDKECHGDDKERLR